MTRRIAIAFAILAFLLGMAIVVPLGVVAMRSDRADFRDAALADARSMASTIDGATVGTGTGHAWDQWVRRGDRVTLVAPDGQVVPGEYGQASLTAADRSLVRQALSGRDASRWGHDLLVVAVPVEGWSGSIVLARPAEQLDARIGARWLLLGTVGVLAVVGAAGLAGWLGRRLARPVTDLQRSVGAFGAGDLAVRARSVSGPPEVRALAGEFNRTAARLDQVVRGHRTLVADVAHQVRTPLAALRLHLELAAEDASGPVAEEIEAALNEVARLSRLLDGLLAAARAESGSGRRTSVDVAAVVVGRANLWRPLAEERGAVVETPGAEPGGSDGFGGSDGSEGFGGSGGSDRWHVQVGEGHLEQVLDNLLANALDAGAHHVRLRLERLDGHVAVRVIDDGPGLSPTLRESVLDRYAAGRPGGTGLGLSIVERLVTADGGRLTLTDTPDGGLTVTVELPVPA